MKIRQAIQRILVKIKLRFSDEVLYINGPETLPPPFSAEEEAGIIKRIKNGEADLKQELITHNLRLVVYISKKFDSNQNNLEDLISIGTIGLIKAVNTFCPEKNIKLATYASRCIENEILMYLRKLAQRRNEISLDEPLNVDWDGNELLLSDILGSDKDEVSKGPEQEAEQQALMQCVAGLPKREREIMELRFGLSGNKEHTQKEVADLLNISQSYISRLDKKILLKLRHDIETAIT